MRGVTTYNQFGRPRLWVPSKLGGDNVGAASGLHSKWSDLYSLLQAIDDDMRYSTIWNRKTAAAEEQRGQFSGTCQITSQQISTTP